MAALHCGWQPLAGGIVAEGVRALREVGGDGPDHRRARPERPRLLLRGRRGGPRAVRGLRRPPRASATSTSRRSRARSSTRPVWRTVHDVGLCTMCDEPLLLPPPRRRHHRPPGGGRVPRLITGLDAARIRANLDRVREEIAAAGRDPTEVEILAAVKYVPLEELGVLAEAGLTLLGENRAQDLEAKATAHPRVPLALHRPAAVAQGQADRPVRRADPLGRLGLGAAPARDARDAGHRDPARGQRRGRGGQGGDRARPSSPSYIERSPVPRRGLMTMPPFADDPGGQPPPLRPPARAGRRARAAPALDGYLAGLRGRCSGRCNDRADRHDALRVDWRMQGNPCPPRTTPRPWP